MTDDSTRVILYSIEKPLERDSKDYYITMLGGVFMPIGMTMIGIMLASFVVSVIMILVYMNKKDD